MSLSVLTENLSTSYKNLQLTLQTDGPRDEQAMAERLHTFSLAASTALQRIQAIVESKSLGKDDSMEALGELTWTLLRIAPFLGSPTQNANVATFCGAVVEELGFEQNALHTKEHCHMLFQNVLSFLALRQKSREANPMQSTHPLDAILQSFCPPLMVFFAKNLPYLAAFRETHRSVVDSLVPYNPNIHMIRRFLLQLVQETVLCVYVELDTKSHKPKLKSAQRVTFSGLYVNRDLVQWATTQDALGAELVEIGQATEMACWTALRDDSLLLDNTTEAVSSPHRLKQEGIPNDIAPLQGEKVVLFHRGKGGQMKKGKIFPLIDLEVQLEGAPLTEQELEDLTKNIESASNETVIKALGRQKQRGGSNDDALDAAIMNLQMSALKTEDSSTPENFDAPGVALN